MIHKDYCSRCKQTKIPLMKFAKSTDRKTQYYMCRSCVNNKVKAYRQTDNGKRKTGEANRRTEKKYMKKQRARMKVGYAVRSGKLLKSISCEICNEGGRIEGHHMDYNKPLEVIWLCTGCHADYHKI